MKKSRVPYLFFLASIVLFGCVNSERSIRMNHYPHRYTPPGTVKIGDSLFYDQCETSNIDWREYVYWLEKIYGDTSAEYKYALTFSPTWDIYRTTDELKLQMYVGMESSMYFLYPAYNYYPQVGVSQEQAERYARWRSDRVFERLLILWGIIEYDTMPTPATHFTIERFFNGEIIKLRDVAINFYPEYTLPTYEEYGMALEFSDNIGSLKKKKYCQKAYPERHVFLDVAPGDSMKFLPVMPVCSDHCSPIKFIRGNVSEWLKEPNMTAGGSWHDRPETISQTDLFRADTPSPWIGFRNVCKMRVWKRE